MAAPRLALLLTVAAFLALPAVQYQNPEGSPEDLTARGNTALHNRQFDTAIAFYKRALEADHDYFYALFNLGLTYQERAQITRDPEARTPLYHDARRYYEQALNQRRDNAQVHCNLGIIAYHLQEFQLAVQHFHAAHQKATDPYMSAEYAYNRGTAQERLQLWSEAKSSYEVCRSQNPDHFGARYNLGTLLLRHLDDPAAARLELMRAKAIDPKRPEPLLNLGVLSEKHNVSEAEKHYNEAVAKAADYYPNMVNDVRWRRALFYWHHDLPGKAAKVLARNDLQSILDLDPRYPGANGLLGQYYESVAQYGKAIEHLEREVNEDQFDPSNPIDRECHFFLAIIYRDHTINPGKMLEHAQRYHEILPTRQSHELLRQARRRHETDVLLGTRP